MTSTCISDGRNKVYRFILCSIVYFVVSQNTLFTVILFHHLDDCDLYTPPRGVKGRQNQVENDQPGQNEELVPKRGTTSVAWTRVFKHCRLKKKKNDFKPLKLKQQSYLRAPSLFLCERSAHFFAALLALNDYINTLICVRIPVFASILINTVI